MNIVQQTAVSIGATVMSVVARVDVDTDTPVMLH